ncbi:type IV secretory system conjugative DNA transfer family protein [Halorubrum vacuolatum]|nr:TraM recognition domain-containing protein [Halorubrum vacuolatum]
MNPRPEELVSGLQSGKEVLDIDNISGGDRDDIHQIHGEFVGVIDMVYEMEEFEYAYTEVKRKKRYGAELQSFGIPEEIDPNELPPGQDGVEVYATGEAEEALRDIPRDHPDAPLFVGKGTRNGRDASIDKNHLFRHRAVFGVTGYGKSTLLTNDARQLIESGAGLCFIDPKGDDSFRLMQTIPEHRLDDVVWIEPGASGDYLSGFNFITLNLDPDDDEYDAALASLVDDLKKMLAASDDYWGPRMDRVAGSLITAMNLYNAKTPDDAPEMNLVDMYYVLKSEASRYEFAARAHKADLRFVAPHLDTISKMSEDDLEPLLGRFLPWIQNPVARRMIGFRSGGINIPEAIDNNKIIIVRMGSQPRELKQMLGMAVIRRIWSHIRARSMKSQYEREPFYLFCDEFDNLALGDETIPAMISESRSYRLSMTLANQYPAQLPSNVVEAITTNCDTIMSFNPGDQKSARTYNTQLGLDPQDLTEEVNYHVWMRTTISENMERSDAFRVYIYPPFPPLRTTDEAQAAIDASLKKLGRRRRSDEEVYQNLLFNEGQGRWETGIGRYAAMADGDERQMYLQQLVDQTPTPDDPNIKGAEDRDTSPGGLLPSTEPGNAPANAPGRQQASQPTSAKEVVERHLDAVLESIFAARLRAGKDPNEYVSLEDAKQELLVRLPDAAVDSLSELSNIYEQVNEAYAETQRSDGDTSIRLTSQGRGIVLQQDTGSAGSGGGDDHRWILGEAYVAFTQIGYKTWLPEQEGEEAPDGVAEVPIDPTDVDDNLSRSKTLDAINERQDELREKYPGVWNFAGPDDVAIEAETSTIKYPFQTFNNLRKAMENGDKCVFAVKDGSAKHGGFTYWAERAEKVIYETEGGTRSAEVVSDEVTFRKSPTEDGHPRYYNDGGGDYRVGEDQIALRPKLDGDGETNRSTIWYREKDTGDVVAAVETPHGEENIEFARFDTPEEAHEGNKYAVPAYYEYDKSEEEYVLHVDGEKKYYPDKEGILQNWVPFRGPFIPEARFDEWPTTDNFEIIIFPDSDNEEYNQPQIYHRGECRPLFDELGVSASNLSVGEIGDTDGDVEATTDDEDTEEEEEEASEDDGDEGTGEEDADESDDSDESGDEPMEGPPVDDDALTPSRIAADERVELTAQQIADYVTGDLSLPWPREQKIRNVILSNTGFTDDYPIERLREEIVIPEGGVQTEAAESDEEADTDDTSKEVQDDADDTEHDETPPANDESAEHNDTPADAHEEEPVEADQIPTPARIAEDSRVDLTAEEITAIATGEKEPGTNTVIALMKAITDLSPVAGDAIEDVEDLSEQIVIPEEPVEGDTDEQSAQTDAVESGEEDERAVADVDVQQGAEADGGQSTGEYEPEREADVEQEHEGSEGSGRDDAPELAEPTVEYREPPTPARLADDPRVELSEDTIHALADGVFTPSEEELDRIRAALNDLIEGDQSLPTSAVPAEEIVVEEVEDTSTDEQGGDTEDTGGGMTPEEAAAHVEQPPEDHELTSDETIYATPPTPDNLAAHPKVTLPPVQIEAAARGNIEISKKQQALLRAALKDYTKDGEAPLTMDQDPTDEVLLTGS